MSLPESCSRNPVALSGSIVLSGAGTVATLVAVSVAPRTTLGLAALGSGLLVAGNHSQLSDWYQSHYGSSSSDSDTDTQSQAE